MKHEFSIFNVCNECVSNLNEMCISADLFPSISTANKWCICCEFNEFYDSYYIVPFTEEEYESIVKYSKQRIGNKNNVRSCYYIVDYVFTSKETAVAAATDLRNGYATLHLMREVK